mmetsp:Transcript_39837/g.68330  ORF Transcript_39837/g.68330 Transcript_39837/m.68330 type:complete len:216 (-) Transcript_39837:1024-1671(-)
MPWSEGNLSVGKTMLSSYCLAPVLSRPACSTVAARAGKRMKSFGFLSPFEIFSSARAAFCSCACRKVRALYVVCLFGSGESPQQDEYPLATKSRANSVTPCLEADPLSYVFASRPKSNVCEGMVSASLCTASSTRSVASPLVSPWKEASRYLRPTTSTAEMTSRSPLATGTDLSKDDMTACVCSCTDAAVKSWLHSRMTEFWSRLPSREEERATT